MEYGERAYLNIESRVGEGTLITIRIPALQSEKGTAGQKEDAVQQ